MKRKMVSFILCIAMCMALAIPAFAVELSPYATDEVGNFSQMIEFAFSDNVEGRFRYSYNDAAGNVVDGIVIKEISTDGTTKLNFVEGDKSDKVEIDSIRDVILNGNCIIEASNDGCTLAAAYPYNPFLRKISPKNQLPCNQQPAADLFELVALTMLYNRFAHRQAQFDLLRRGIFQHACKFNRNADVWMNRNVASKQSIKINAQCCRYIHQ